MNAPDPSISPGIGGFLAFFLLACALWLLMRSMLRHLRGLDHRVQLEEEQEEGADVTTRPTGLGGRPADRADGGGRDGPDDESRAEEAPADADADPGAEDAGDPGRRSREHADHAAERDPP